ncbi:hypothetical protein BKA63DRAFT_190243 [Paraphoma chrysanthemicola]|nr:hypothetical protein BKA63DRAFT_190243 [Paraphoma chrysanthemicola]
MASKPTPMSRLRTWRSTANVTPRPARRRRPSPRPQAPRRTVVHRRPTLSAANKTRPRWAPDCYTAPPLWMRRSRSLPGLIQSTVSKALYAALEDALPYYLSVPISPSSSQSISRQSTRAHTPKSRAVIDTILTRRVLPGLEKPCNGCTAAHWSTPKSSATRATRRLLEELGNLRYELQPVRTDCEVELNDIRHETLDCHRGLQSATSLAEVGQVQDGYCRHTVKCWPVVYKGDYNESVAHEWE